MLASQALRASPISSSLRPSCLRILRAPPYHPSLAQTRLNQYRRFGSRYQRFQQTKNFFHRWSQRPTFYYEVAGLGGVVGGFYIYNLETVPVSGRRRFNIISPKTEEELGKQQYQQVLAQYRGQLVSDWDPRVRMVRRVMERLIPVSGLQYQEWEIHVIESEERNAFVLPG
jgi:metalloendopeptidase OMA1, mitochondrial